MVRIREVIVVEGRYDQNTLRQIVAIFRETERQKLLRRLAQQRGIIVFTDPDGAGRVIRGFLNGIVDPRYVKNAFIPDVPGKEKRKSSPSKERKLGVEGTTPEIILNAQRSCGATMYSKTSSSRPRTLRSTQCKGGANWRAKQPNK